MSVYCTECKHLDPPTSNEFGYGCPPCCLIGAFDTVDTPFGKQTYQRVILCSEKNKNMDCADFEQAPPRTIWQTLKKCFAMS